MNLFPGLRAIFLITTTFLFTGGCAPDAHQPVPPVASRLLDAIKAEPTRNGFVPTYMITALNYIPPIGTDRFEDGGGASVEAALDLFGWYINSLRTGVGWHSLPDGEDALWMEVGIALDWIPPLSDAERDRWLVPGIFNVKTGAYFPVGGSVGNDPGMYASLQVPLLYKNLTPAEDPHWRWNSFLVNFEVQWMFLGSIEGLMLKFGLMYWHDF